MRKLTKKLNNNTFVGSDGSDVNGYQMEGGGRRFKKMRKAPGKFFRSAKRSYKKQHLGHKGHTYRKGRLNNTKKRLNQKTTHHTKKIEASQKRKTALEHEIRVAGKKMESKNDPKYKIKYQNIINKSKKKLITEEQRMRNSEKSLSKIKRNTEINVAKLNKVEKDYEKKLAKKTSKMENIHSKYKTMGGIKKFFRSKVPFSDAKRYKSIKKAAKKTGQTTTQFLYNENGKLKPNVLNNIIAKRESKKRRFSIKKRGYSKNISQWIKNRKKKISSTTDANSGIKIAGEKINEAKGLIKNLRKVANNSGIDTNKVELNRRKETDSKRRQQKVLEFRKERNEAFKEELKTNQNLNQEVFKAQYHTRNAKEKFGNDFIERRNDYKIAKNANIIGDVSGREDLKKLFKKQITGPNPSWNTNKFRKYKDLKNKGNTKTKQENEQFEELEKNRTEFKKTFLKTIQNKKQNEQKLRQERREKNIRKKYDQVVQERIINIQQKIKDYPTSGRNKITVEASIKGAKSELQDLFNYQKLREQQQQQQQQQQ